MNRFHHYYNKNFHDQMKLAKQNPRHVAQNKKIDKAEEIHKQSHTCNTQVTIQIKICGKYQKVNKGNLLE